MTMLEHKCVPMSNPRHRSTCRKCGKLISRLIPEQTRRDQEFERELVKQASIGLSVDPEPLIQYAQKRADEFASEYKRDFPSPDRDLIQETLDEIADGINYTCWKLDSIRRGFEDGGDRVVHLQRGLRHGLLWFEEMRQAR